MKVFYKAIDKALKEEGFILRNKIWYRDTPYLTQLIEITQYNARVPNTGKSFSLSIGLFNSQVYKLTFSSTVPKKIEIPDCIVYFRIRRAIS